MRPTDTPPNINYGAHITPGAPETLQAQRIEIEGVKRVHTPGHGWGIEVDNETPEFSQPTCGPKKPDSPSVSATSSTIARRMSTLTRLNTGLARRESR